MNSKNKAEYRNVVGSSAAREPLDAPCDSSRDVEPRDKPGDSEPRVTDPQPTLPAITPVRSGVSGERAVEEGLARRVIGWLNELQRSHGRLHGHKGFDPFAKDVLKAAARWRKAKLSPEEVIAVCEHRIALWRLVTGDWLNNCTPKTLFDPSKFDAALQEMRAGHKHTQVGNGGGGQARRGFRKEGVETGPNSQYETRVVPV